MKEKKKFSQRYDFGRYKIGRVLFYTLFLGAFLFSLISKNVLIASEAGSKEGKKEDKKVVDKKEVKKKKQKIGKKAEKKKKIKNKKKEKKEKKEKKVLLIGDSLAYAMSLNNTYTGTGRRDEIYWLTEGGVGIRFIPEDFNIVLGKTMPRAFNNTLTKTMKVDLLKEVKEKKIEHIAVLIGINSSDERGAKETVKRLEEMRKKTGCDIYYMGSFPIVDAKAEENGYQVRDSRAVSYNKWMQEGLKDTEIEYIDSYSIVKKQKNYARYTWDGIHYQKEMYDKVIEVLFEKIEGKEKMAKESERLPELK